ncbi:MULTISPECIES: right-handed parallel beta-helix repeat-containing protein [unclassified Geodermatophilus]|uniref:right-handed parallel beta-helix repeat-containing protein n=1 Tax=unclassified Geodermatophilus TaxID=2637632 RepID=UPI003EF04331
MRIRRSRVLVVASVAAVTTLGLAGPASADDAHPEDFDIQEAVDRAESGDTVHIPPGTYHQNVEITTDHITLSGYDVVLRPADDAEPTQCDGPAEEGAEARISGICVFGEVVFPAEDDPTGEIEVVDAVEGVTVLGITVEDFTGNGLIGLGTVDLEVEDSRFEDNGGYGAASFVTHGTTFHHNAAVGNTEAGFYVGDSPDAQADVHGNHSTGNELGYFFRNASHGWVKHNVAEGNCVGTLVLSGAPGLASGWEYAENEVTANNKVCAGVPEEGIPPLSGAGVALVGAQDFLVHHNTVTDNASDAESAVEGGIVVVSSASVPGLMPFDPMGTVAENWVFGNEPADLVTDGTGDVDFDDNRCDTPAELCD